MAYFECFASSGGSGQATLTVIGTATFSGLTCTCTDGITTLTKTFPSTSPYDINFDIPNEGTWTVSVTYSGDTYTETVQISLEQTIDLGLFNYQTWLSEGGVTGTYADLDAVLEDEEAVRRLFTVHKSVDYLKSRIIDANITKIINNDLCAKWINLSDYALDTLYDVNGIKSVMDTADKYGYGEWCLMPQVPKMTSDTAPYGVASSNVTVYSGCPAYKAFDGDDSTWWASNQTSGTGTRLSYHFVNSICPKRAMVLMGDTIIPRLTAFYVIGSNDGSTWERITDNVLSSLTERSVIEINTSKTFSYLGVEIDHTNRPAILSLQFYAYAPKGNVPIMTSNTAPYGEASTNAPYGASGYEAYRAFDGDMSTQWQSSNTGTSSLGRLVYKFINPVNVRRVWQFGAAAQTETLRVQYSDDGTNFTDVADSDYSIAGSKIVSTDIDDNGYHLYWAVNHISSASTSRALVRELQFYGRELSVSIPVMTSNTAPYGEAIASSEYATPTYAAWRAFDNDDTSGWNNANAEYGQADVSWVGYDFGRPIIVKLASYFINNQGSGSFTDIMQKVIASNDKQNWYVVSGVQTTQGATFEVDTDGEAYRYYAVRGSFLHSSFGQRYDVIARLQFYGLDYSEKEFETGTTKKWLYDHGLELETISTLVGTGGSVTKNPSYITCKGGGTGIVNRSGAGVHLDLTPYSLAFTRLTSPIGGNSTNFAVTSDSLTVGSIAATATTTPLNEVVKSIDVSSINQTYYLTNMTYDTANAMTSFNELWLE